MRNSLHLIPPAKLLLSKPTEIKNLECMIEILFKLLKNNFLMEIYKSYISKISQQNQQKQERHFQENSLNSKIRWSSEQDTAEIRTFQDINLTT